MFLWIGPLFRRIGPRVSQDRTFSKTNAPIPKKHPVCHLKNAELEAKHQKYKGRVVLRGDIVKDDSGSYAVFTEQGSSASQMTDNSRPQGPQ